MSLDLAADLPTMFADFSTDATIGAATVRGLFNDGYSEFSGIAGSSPSLLVSSLAVPSAALGDAVVIGGTSYTIASIEPDGTGATLLKLAEAA